MTTPKTWVVAALALLLAGAPLRAQDEPAEAPVRQLVEKPVDAPAAEKPKANPLTNSAADGFVLQSENGDFKLQLRGLVQFDGRFFPGDPDDLLLNNFLVRRARPIFLGTVARYFDFNFTPDFGGGTTVIQDAYLVARVSPKLAVRIGKFKPPIGMEHLQSDAQLPFIERALAASLVPSRDVGVQIGGDLANGVLSYAAGVFNGTPDGASVDTDTSDGKALVGRVVISPFKAGKSALSGLGFGIAGSTEKQSGTTATLAGYRTGGQNSFFSYSAGVAPAGTRRRGSAELSYFSGPVGILAEYVKSEASVLKTTTIAATATTPARTATTGPFTVENHAWQATATVFVSGGTAGYDGPKIKTPLDPAKGQWGALQLAARVNQFTADGDTFANNFADVTRSARKATAWGVGLNWYANKNIKQMVGFERTTFEGGAAKGDRKAENALFMRAQLSF
jgi:phosphate-selective porin OprO and OprP